MIVRTMPNPLLVDIPESLVTERLLLRPPRAGDGPAFCDALASSLPEMRRFLGHLPWVVQDPTPESMELHCRTSHTRFVARTDLPYLLFDRASGRVLGGCGLHRTDWDVPRTEVGYWVRSDEAGKGYASEAVRALVALAFDVIGAVRVELVTDADNAASRAVADRCGFTLEGTLRQHLRAPGGALRDTCIYARLRPAG